MLNTHTLLENAEVVAIHKLNNVPFRKYDEDRDGYKEEFDAEGRKVTYFKGGSKGGMIYFIDLQTKTVIGKKSVSAGNSYQTSDPGKDLLDNYYNEIDKIKSELGMIN
jgi:hypothetical protein